MKELQLTLIQIDNYGPWTVTPRPKREAELQILQSSLYSALQGEFSRRKGIVFPLRLDNMLAISNGLSLDDHREILDSVNGRFPVTVSMGVGTGRTAYEAQLQATLSLQSTGSSRSERRKGVLTGSFLPSPGKVQIAHFDVNHSAILTDSYPIYDTHLLLQRAHLQLIESMKRREALVFYMGGDNYISICNGTSPADLLEVISEVKRRLGVEFKAGVGLASDAETAARLAAEALHEIRRGQAQGPIVYKSL